MTNNAVISTGGRNLFYQEPLGYPELLRRYAKMLFKNHSLRTGLVFIILLSGFLGQESATFAQMPNNTIAAALSGGHLAEDQLKVVHFNGDVFCQPLKKKYWYSISPNQVLVDGDTIKTGPTGYVILAFSTDNMLLVKPRSEINFIIDPLMRPRVRAKTSNATILLSVRQIDGIHVTGLRGSLKLRRGDVSYQTNASHDLIKALQGTTIFHSQNQKEPTEIPEGYLLEIDRNAGPKPFIQFDTRQEYENFHRFSAWIKWFEKINLQSVPAPDYKPDTVFVNDRFIGQMEVGKDGFRILDSGAGPIPLNLHFRMKFTPYPRPNDRFELYLNKDFIFPLSEGGNGFFEAKVPVPAFPDFFVKVHHIDSLGQKVVVFETRFVLFSKRRKEGEIRSFLKEVSRELENRNVTFFRQAVSNEYRDWFGNTYYDFLRLLDDLIRSYRDIRLVLHPHTFVFRENTVQVRMNYRLTALNRDWSYRFEDLGSDVWTLELMDGKWRIRSKARGMLFQRMKIVVDPRRGVLRGRVVNEADKTPISGASIRILNSGFKTTSDRMGEYIIYNLPPGFYDVEISKNGFGKITIKRMEIKATGEKF